MEYTEQSITDTRFYILKGAFDLEQFVVLKQSQSTWNNYAIEYGILGESHFVSLKNSNEPEQFYEICACSEAQLQEGTIIFLADELVKIEKKSRHKLAEALQYTLSYEIHGWAAGSKILTELNAESDSKPNENVLRYTFPTEASDDIEPVTSLRVESGDHILNVTSIHTYPNESKIIVTNSIFETAL